MRNKLSIHLFLCILLTAVSTAVAYSQTSDENWNLVWREDFGVAEDTVAKDFADKSKHDVVGHHFITFKEETIGWNDGKEVKEWREIGECGVVDDGKYCIANSTRWAVTRPAKCNSNQTFFRSARDHTGNDKGAMLIINVGGGVGESLYKQDIDFDLCDSKKYRFGLYAASITQYDAPEANLTLQVFNKTKNELIGKIETGDIPLWHKCPTNGDSNADPFCEDEWNFYYIDFDVDGKTELELNVINHKESGGGNDVVIDDISLWRLDEDIKLPDLNISESAIASQATSSCSYTGVFQISDEAMQTWRMVDKSVYVLWQKSSDSETWTNLTDDSGIEKSKLTIDIDGSESATFRAIITASPTDAEAKAQAEYIGANDAPMNGCAYYSISNILSSIKPEPNCKYKANLKTLWSEDFGICDTMGVGSNSGITLNPFTQGGTKDMQYGEYAICAVPDSAIYYTGQWDQGHRSQQWGLKWYDNKYNASSPSGFTSSSEGDAFALIRISKQDQGSDGTFFKKTLDIPFCPCKAYMLNAELFVPGSEWGTTIIPKISVLSYSGDTLGTNSPILSYNTKMATGKMITTAFEVPEGYNGPVTAVIELDFNANIKGSSNPDWCLLGLDNLSITMCGEFMPPTSIGVNGTKDVAETGFECGDETKTRTVDLYGFDGWSNDYPLAGFVWQTSTDGGNTWSNLASTQKSIPYEYDGVSSSTIYRCIVGETQAVANEVAATGKPTDECQLYYISNTAGFVCKEVGCKEATLTLSEEDDVTKLDTIVCNDEANAPIEIKIYQKNKVAIDEWVIATRADESAKWVTDATIAQPTEADYVWTLPLPNATQQYKIYAKTDTCKSDSMYINVKVKDPITIKALEDTIVCAGSTYTIKFEVESGEPTEYYYGTTESNMTKVTDLKPDFSASVDILGVTTANTWTIRASNGACVSNDATFKLDYEDNVDFYIIVMIGEAQTERSGKICAGDPIQINYGISFENHIPGQESKNETHTYTLLAEDEAGRSETFKFVDFRSIQDEPLQNTTYTVSGVGKYCKEPVNQKYKLTVEQPQELDLKLVDSGDGSYVSDTEGKVCEGASITLESTASSASSWNWEKLEKDAPKYVAIENESTTTRQTFIVTKDTKFRISTPVSSTSVCKSALSPAIAISVEDSIRFELALDEDRFCESGNAQLSIKSKTEYDDSQISASANSSAITITGYTYSEAVAKDTKYEVSISGDRCPAVTKDTTVRVDQPLSFSFNLDETEICKGDKVTIEIVGDASGAVWYQQEAGSEATIFTLPADYKISPTTNTDIYATSPALGACAPFTTPAQTIIVEEPVEFTIDPITEAICKGTKVKLKGTLQNGVANTVVWDNGTKDIANTIETEDTPTADVTYSLSITGKKCPRVTHSVFTTVESIDELTLSASAEKICENTSVTLTPTFGSNDESKITWWQEIAGRKDKIAASTNITPSTTTSYYISTKGDICPETFSNTVTVEVEDSVRFTFAANTADLICEGTEVTLTAQQQTGEAKNVSFSTGESSTAPSIAGGFTYKTKPTADAAYQFTVIGDKCPAVSHEVNISVEKNPVLAFSASETGICEGETITLNLSAENAEAVIWEKSTDGRTYTEFGSLMTSQTITPTESATYRVTSTGKQVCREDTKSAFVEVEPKFDVDLPNIAEACPNVQNTIQATIIGAPTTIKWEQGPSIDALSLMAASIDHITVSPTKTTIYRVTVSGKYCEDQYDMLTLSVADVPTLTIDASSDHICEGDDITLQAVFSNDNFSESSILWTEKSGESATSESGIQAISRTPSSTTTYTATATTDGGCQITAASAVITVDKAIVASIDDAITICEGGKAKLTVDAADSYSYSWTSTLRGDTVMSKSASCPLVARETETLSIEIANGICTETLPVFVTVVGVPHITEVEDLGDRKYDFITTGGSGQYEYDFGNGFQSSSILTNAISSKRYHAVVRDAAGCSSDTTFAVPTYEIEINPVFTPNGDGENDLFEIKNIDKYPTAKITLYDRTGKVILRSTGAEYEAWDGTYLGRRLPSTDYWYEIHVFEVSKTYTGHFTLLNGGE